MDGTIQLANRILARVPAMLMGVALLLCLFSPEAAQAQSTSAEARVTVVRPLTLTYVDDLSFGRVVPGTAGGTVVVNPDDSSCTTTGTVLQVGTCEASNFAGLGGRNMQLRMRVKSSSIQLTGPGTAMVMDNFVFDYDPDLDYLRTTGQFNVARIISTSGIFTFRVGGTLHVNANQTPGTYSGDFDVQVQYQ